MITEVDQITSVSIVYTTVCPFVHVPIKISKLSVTCICEGIHRWAVASLHKVPVTGKMFPFDDVIMLFYKDSY